MGSINGTVYGWSSIKANIMGINVIEIDEISYEETQEMEMVYGAGSDPIGRGFGKNERKGSIGLFMSTVENLQASVDTGRLQDIPDFPIIVSYLPKGGKIVTHTLSQCRFTNNKREAKSGDMHIKVQCELSIGGIAWK
jgi:hypothetical protein